MINRTLTDFVRESNLIEGIVREPKASEITAHQNFLRVDDLRVWNLEQFVEQVEPGSKLRRRKGMDALIGWDLMPTGGPMIEMALDQILMDVRESRGTPFVTHCKYENLHPFTDGNGRSGRALWLWMMVRRDGEIPTKSFLKSFYFQALQS